MIKITHCFVQKSNRQIFGCIMIIFIFNVTLVLPQTANSEEARWEGKAVFENKGCLNCHPVNGIGGKGGPDLRKDVYYGTYLELASLMWNHYPKMARKMDKMETKYPMLSEQEMSNLITYLSFQRYLGEPGSDFTGRKLLKSKGCFSCHRFGGKGKDIGPDIGKRDNYLSPLALVESMWNHGPDMMEIFEELDLNRPLFHGNDIAHLASGIRSFMPPASSFPTDLYNMGNPVSGEKLVHLKGCLNCHSVRGEGKGLASDFAETSIDYSVTQIAGEMWNHAPEMWKLMKSENISIPKFEKGEMADVISFLYFLNF